MTVGQSARRIISKMCVDLVHIISACIVYGIVLYPHYLLIRFLLAHVYATVAIILSPAFIYTFLLGLTVVLTAVRMSLPEIQEGLHQTSDKKALFVFVLHHFLQLFMDIPFRPILHRTGFLCYGFYKGMGMKLSPSTRISPTCLFRMPSLISIGHNTVLGGLVTIVAYMSLSPEHIYFKRVQIGNHVFIGAGAMIWPGVEVGDDSLILAGAEVLPGTKIPAGEAWGGRPAKPLGTKKLFTAIALQMRS
jgi:serine acetyltransferase